MRTLVRRLVPGLVLPLLLVGLSPSQAAEPGSPAAPASGVLADAPTPAEVSSALSEVPAALVPDTAPVSGVSPQAVVSGAVTVPRNPALPVQLGPAKGGLSIGLPATDADASVVRDGVSIFQDDAAATSYAVNPLAGGGAQFLLAIGGPDSPEEHAFPIDVPAGAQLALTEDGGAQVTGADGTTLASIPAPWARDANDRAIPTHFTVVDGAIVQVVEHVGAGAAYPVVADPTFTVGWTGLFVRWSRGEVKYMNDLTLLVLGAALSGYCAGPHLPLCLGAAAGIYKVVNDLTDYAIDVLYNRGCRVETRLTPYIHTYLKC